MVIPMARKPGKPRKPAAGPLQPSRGSHGAKTPRDPVVPVRLPPEMLADVDAWAKAAAVSRSDAIRGFIAKGLKRPSASPRKKPS